MTCCVISMLIWSFISSILLIRAYLTWESCDVNQYPLILGKYEGPRWFNKDQTLDRKILVENKWVSLSQHTVKTHNGKIIDDWLWIDTANQINVMVTTMIDGQELFVVFEQTKYGYSGLSLATVGGHIDPEDKEDGLKAAKRELMEEMGMKSDEWINFGKYRTDVNRGLGFCHTFLARKAIQIKKLKKYEDETEEMSIKYLTMQELKNFYMKGMFKEAKWSNTVGLSLMWMLSNTKVNQQQQQ